MSGTSPLMKNSLSLTSKNGPVLYQIIIFGRLTATLLKTAVFISKKKDPGVASLTSNSNGLRLKSALRTRKTIYS